jgi:ADP-heptose:LPS heptosyltransferase
MTSPDSPTKTYKVLIIRLTALGDVVQCLEALKPFQQAVGARVKWSWAVADVYQPLLEGEPNLELIPVPRRWSCSKWWRFRQTQKQRDFDLIIDAQTLLKSLLVSKVWPSVTTLSWGGAMSRDWLTPKLASLTLKKSDVSSRKAYAELFRMALHHLGLSVEVPALEHPSQLPTQHHLKVEGSKRESSQESASQQEASQRGASEQESLKTEFLETGSRKCICAPGSAWPTKQLGASAWDVLLKQIRQDEPNMPIWMLAGSESERMWIQEQLPKWSAFGVTLLDPMSLRELKNFFDADDLFIGMDSGPTHLAASRGLRTLSFYGASLPEAYAPIGPRHHSTRGDCHLGACFERRCDQLRVCETCSAITSIDVLSAWKKFRADVVQPL